MSGFEQFIQERIYLRNVSPRTVDWYHQTFKWLEQHPLTEQGLKDLVVSMRQAGLQPISCNSRIRCINAYLKWAGLPPERSEAAGGEQSPSDILSRAAKADYRLQAEIGE